MIASLLQRQGIRQLIKFCIVGFSSMIVDKGLLWVLSKQFMVLERLPYVPWWSWVTLTFCCAVTNGFIWNQRWTFRAREHGRTNTQYIKFIATNCVGLLLNLLITKMFLMYFTGTVVHEENPDANRLLLSSICAIPFVVVWNFSAAKYWTFRAPKSLGEPLSTSTNNAPSDETTQLA